MGSFKGTPSGMQLFKKPMNILRDNINMQLNYHKNLD